MRLFVYPFLRLNKRKRRMNGPAVTGITKPFIAAFVPEGARHSLDKLHHLDLN